MPTRTAVLALFVGLAALLALAVKANVAEPKIRALIVTGGHDYEREPFLALFRSIEGITFKEAVHPNFHTLLKPEAAKEYDVLVLYDLWQEISEEAKADFVNLIKQGKPVVALHHSLAGYNEWPEYSKIIGGRYRLKKETVNGVERPGSVYQHDVKFNVKVVDPAHPVTRGLKDFEMLDETYGDFDVAPGVKPLLTTDHPTSTRTIAWCHTYSKSRVVYIQLGHDHHAYEHPAYRRLVAQAIRWASEGQKPAKPRR